MYVRFIAKKIIHVSATQIVKDYKLQIRIFTMA